jgi:FAD/FMN-containing dehydrogenase
MNINNYIPFNKYPKLYPDSVTKPVWLTEIDDSMFESDKLYLCYGKGKSYGDVCLNEGNTIIDMSNLNHLIDFNKDTGVIECEAGITLSKILEFIVPYNWFLPVTPGTKFITLGGAVANDVHGKNHHVAGTFGNHIVDFKLLRSDGNVYKCSKNENTELFEATIGGIGLTGIIKSVRFQLKRIENPFMYVENIKFNNLDEFYSINEESERDFPYTVSWVDCTTKGKSMGRGIYMRGKHASNSDIDKQFEHKDGGIPFPIQAPFINIFTVKAFNKLFYSKQLKRVTKQIVPYEPYFYPLDFVDGWENAYGKNGFLQHQFVLPTGSSKDILKEIFNLIVSSGMSSFLTVLKTFGELKSPGMLSFPQKGITLAIDYRMEGQKTLDLLKKIDDLLVETGGRIYPGKDARMSKEHFHKFYPNFDKFVKYIDPKFSSSFYRRIK